MAKLLQEIEDQIRYEHEHGREPTGPFEKTAAAIFFTFLAFLLVTSLFGGFAAIWQRLPDFFSSIPGGLLAGAVTVGIGAGLFQLRERRRFLYAYLELGSAFAAAVQACTRLNSGTETSTVLFALLGCVYLAVRGFDNLTFANKARGSSRART